jgi:hypothetical protein
MKNRATYGHLAFANFPTSLFRPLPKIRGQRRFSEYGVRYRARTTGSVMSKEALSLIAAS